jgi:HAD superfamily hydrolase (TIGR01509 family)
VIRAVLFDVDGTLMDNNLLHIQAWKEAFKPYRAFDDAQLLRYVGMGSDTYIQSLAPDLDLATRETIRNHKREIYKVLGAKAAPFPGAKAVLDESHRRGLSIALASSANRVEIERYIAMMGIAPLISAITTASDVTRTKPDPDLFIASLEKLEVTPREAFVVGDTPYDVQAASRAGLPTIGVLSGGLAQATLEAAGAFMVLSDVGELAARLNEVIKLLEARGV